MAAATGPVTSSVTHWGDDMTLLPLASAAATYYPGAMICIDTSGNAVKASDTAGLQFAGINTEGQNVVVFSGESAGDRKVLVKRPWRFEMDIASAAAGDEGNAVYVKYDNEVAYSGVSNSILVGWVDRVISATRVLVNPIYGPLTNLSVASNTLTFAGTTGSNTVVMPDNLADGLSIKEGANSYLTFKTTDSAERVILKKQLQASDNIGVGIGDGDDIVLTWDATRLNVTQATANSEIRWGVDGAGIDQRWYGDTASAYALWDQSADQLILGGVATMSGLRVATSGATAITTTRAVTKADSGGVFTVAQSSAYTITVATPGGAGERYLFQLVSPGANTVSIVATGCTFEGTITIDAATIPATGSTLTFATGASVLGDTIELISTSTSKFLVRAISSGAGGIAIA